LLAASSLVLAAGGDLQEAAFIGSVAAAIQVSRVGNLPISSSEISKWIQE